MPKPTRQTNNKFNQKIITTKMKSQEQNNREVMSYLKNSSQHFFESEDGKKWQAIVYLKESDRYVFVKDGEVSEINVAYYLAKGITAGKTGLKQKISPQFNPYSGSWYKGYGHGPAAKLRAVRYNKFRRELIDNSIVAYLLTQTEKGSV